MAEPTYTKSPIDNLFYELYGYYPSKAGQSYEMIVAATIKLIYDTDVAYNKFVRGVYSDTVYQLDCLIENDNKPIEAKDYTIDNRKVGRGDLQKLQGALNDLSVDKAFFASATSFTKPAKKYSEAPIPNNKPIELLNIRPVIESDKQGRITKIVFNIHAYCAAYERAKFDFIWTENAINRLKIYGFENRQMNLAIGELYDANGVVIETIKNLTKQYPPGTIYENNFISRGCWILNGCHLKLENHFYELKGISYEVPFFEIIDELVIDAKGSPKIYVKSENGDINKLISDIELKKIRFINGIVEK